MAVVGEHVEFCRRILGRASGQRGEQRWMPMVVTAVREDGTVDGVVFSAEPQHVGLRSNSFPVLAVGEGADFDQWRAVLPPPTRIDAGEITWIILNEIQNNPDGALVEELHKLLGGGASWAPPPTDKPGQVLFATDAGYEWGDLPVGGPAAPPPQDDAPSEATKPKGRKRKKG